MATLSPSTTPDVTLPELFESSYSSPTLIITVGTERVPFSIHRSKLAETGFFDVHVPLTEDEKAHIRAVGEAGPANLVKAEDGTMRIIPAVVADFHIEDRFLLQHRAAFDVFVKFLYNENPTRPTTKAAVKTLRQAYGLAIKYRCFALQNRIIDCLRAYYARKAIVFDDLIWASNRLGDNTECALNAYLVEQIAFEISNSGLPDFAERNDYIWTFLKEGDRYIRLELFKALCRYAQKASKGDPATSGSRFHVHEKGPQAGERKD